MVNQLITDQATGALVTFKSCGLSNAVRKMYRETPLPVVLQITLPGCSLLQSSALAEILTTWLTT